MLATEIPNVDQFTTWVLSDIDGNNLKIIMEMCAHSEQLSVEQFSKS